MALKLFRDWMPTQDIEHEARIARAVAKSGLQVPAVGNIIVVEGRLSEGIEELAPWLQGEARKLHFA